MSYGAEGFGSGEAAGMAAGGRVDKDERISGAFYIGRGTFRMETLEGGVVSAPLIGAHTPARGIGDLPEYSPDDWDHTFARAGEEMPQSDWLVAEPDHRSHPAKMTSRSLVAVLAFISGALVTALLFNMKHSPAPVATPAPTILIPPPPTGAPAPPAEPEAPSLPSPVISAPAKVTAPVVVAKPFRKAAATKERDREKATLARFSKLPASAPPTHWVDPFADRP